MRFIGVGAVVLAGLVAGCSGGADEAPDAAAEKKCPHEVDTLTGAWVWGKGLGDQLKPEWLFRANFHEQDGKRKLILLMGSPTFTRTRLDGEKLPDGTWQFVGAPMIEEAKVAEYKAKNANKYNALRINVKLSVDDSCRVQLRDGWDAFIDGQERWVQSDLGTKTILPIPPERVYSFADGTERLRMFDAADTFKAAEAEGSEFQQYMIERFEEDFVAWSPLTDRKDGCTFEVDFYRDDRLTDKDVAITPEEKDGHLRWVYHHRFEKPGIGTAALHRYRVCGSASRELLGIADNVIDVNKELEEVKADDKKGGGKKG